MNSDARTWYLLKISLVIAGLVILFFSGLAPIENYLSFVPAQNLTASVVPAEVATLTNENRTESGLKALSVNPLLTQAAQLKADDMAKYSYYAHVGPDGRSPLYWLNVVGYKYLNAGENLVIDRTTSAEAVRAWMNSPEHRENILRPQFTEIGVGVSEGQYEGIPTIFVVQEFGTPYPLSIERPRATQTEKSISTRVKEELAPVVQTLSPKLVPKKVASPIVPKKIVATSTPGVVNSTGAPKVSTSTTVSTSSTTSFSYTLPAEFYTPVTFAGTKDTALIAPTIQQNTSEPLWVIKLRSYVQTVTNFVPRVWP